jgi:DNA repair protein RecN (Recombination protein N)
MPAWPRGSRWRAATGAARQNCQRLLAGWKAELKALDAAADLDGLEQLPLASARRPGAAQRKRISRLRKKAAPRLATAVTQAMQQLGMAGGRFEVALLPQAEPQAFGLETVELRVAGHGGSTPRALAKVASGGELSRLALAIAVTTAQALRWQAACPPDL